LAAFTIRDLKKSLDIAKLTTDYGSPFNSEQTQLKGGSLAERKEEQIPPGSHRVSHSFYGKTLKFRLSDLN